MSLWNSLPLKVRIKVNYLAGDCATMSSLKEMYLNLQTTEKRWIFINEIKKTVAGTDFNEELKEEILSLLEEIQEYTLCRHLLKSSDVYTDDKPSRLVNLLR